MLYRIDDSLRILTAKGTPRLSYENIVPVIMGMSRMDPALDTSPAKMLA